MNLLKPSRSHIALAGAMLASALAPVARGAVIVLGASKDAMIFGTNANADTNNASGRGPALFAGADSTPNRKRSLIQFNIAAGLPAGAMVTGATLTLYLGQVAGSGGSISSTSGSAIPSRQFGLFDLLQDWGEGTSGLSGNPPATSTNIGGSGQGYARVTGDSSWDYAFYDSTDLNADKWNSGGPDLHGGNFAGTASAVTIATWATDAPFYLYQPFTWSSAGLVTDVQNWLTAPASNHGWLLKALGGLNSSGGAVDLESTAQSFLGFYSMDGAGAIGMSSVAPTLTVTYSIPEPVFGVLVAALPLLVGPSRRTRDRRVNV